MRGVDEGVSRVGREAVGRGIMTVGVGDSIIGGVSLGLGVSGPLVEPEIIRHQIRRPNQSKKS